MGERDNSRVFKFEKNHTLEKNSEFRVIVYCPIQKMITRNSESASFTELLKSLLVLWVLEETRQTWPMFSELKALVDSERFRVIVCQYRAKIDNSEFSLPSMIPRVTKISELSFLCIGTKTITRNSEFGIHLRMNSEISENSELSLWPIIVSLSLTLSLSGSALFELQVFVITMGKYRKDIEIQRLIYSTIG